MYDYIKMQITSIKLASILSNHPLLHIELIVDDETGDIKFRKAEYQNLKFKIFPNGKIQISGSLHKYWNMGFHNHDDFSLTNLADVIRELEQIFKIDPAGMQLQNLEFGINIQTYYSPDHFLNNLIVFKNKAFSAMRVIGQGNGKQVNFNQYSLKTYNKSLQYKLPYNILRYEKKVTKMVNISDKPVMLKDLMNQEFAVKCLESLLATLDDLIVTEKVRLNEMPVKSRQIFKHSNNPRNWQQMSPKQRCRQKRMYNNIIENFGLERLKSGIYKDVKQKGLALIICG